MNLSARSCSRFGLARRLMAGDLRVVGLRIVTMPFDKAMEFCSNLRQACYFW
jgi:hypothetical protein